MEEDTEVEEDTTWRRIRRGGGYDVEEDTTWRRIRRGGGYDVEEDPLKTAPLQTR
jgi:hypothetical protein